MDKEKPIADWTAKKKRLKREYPDLTDSDLSYVEGEENELFGRIERKLGISRSETRNILRNI